MLLPFLAIAAAVLQVGDGRAYRRIEEAVAAAKPGDTIEVYPSAVGYAGSAIMIRKPRLTIRGIGEKRIVLDGGTFDYSGEGRIPRAIFQADPQAEGTKIEHFELRGAHNGSYNGAGVRINQASNVTVSDCDIHGDDMGIMSNGRTGDPHASENQLITHCAIHGNGNLKDPGYNHNLYLGGTSVTVEFSDIYASLTGHNLKSRAHFNLVRHCYIHDSANRECDFVEAWDTERPNSNAVLIGNVIAKDPNCHGNRMTIHFGQEKGQRNGALFLLADTIVTPFLSPVVELSSSKAELNMYSNIVVNVQESHPLLVEATNGANPDNVVGAGNWISSGYDLRTLHRIGPTYTGLNSRKNPLRPDLTLNLSALDEERKAWETGKSDMPFLTHFLTNYTDGDGNSIDFGIDYRFDGKEWVHGSPRFGAG
ncbi:MAG: hypothetical protein ACHQ50_11745 [Fimbriimonadales bacterium]